MLRTLFLVGLMAMGGVFLLQVAFGLFGWFVALMLWLLGLALEIPIVGACVYFVIRIVSPSTAKRITDSFSGSPGS
ncbi:hypothetical protein LBMAG44_02400 [Gemmatimonadota bacterium]|nr:hypothetical protein LBMAG44_02400 [Gemmatimonadota bacterium]